MSERSEHAGGRRRPLHEEWRCARLSAGFLLALSLGVAGCSDSGPIEPGEPAGGDLLLITSVTDPSGSNGASFVQTVGLDRAQVDNSNAFEQTFRPYPSVYGNDVFVLQGLYGDLAVRYVRGADGRLTEAGRMSLPPGSVGVGVEVASPTKGYVSLLYAGKILIFNPQSMTVTGEIDLTTLGIARNPANPEDNNPEPGLMIIRGGKLYVTLQQLVTAWGSADGADIAIFDVATDRFEKVAHDPRTAAPGNYGFRESIFVDEAGDIYVYCVASFGFVPGQKGGILRIRNGETEFDPGYFISLQDTPVDVPGNRISMLGGVAYGGNGNLYAGAAVPALESNPPNYANDRNFQTIRIRLASGQIDALPLPRSNGIGSGVAMRNGLVVFGLSTTTGVGLYTYNPATGQGSAAPVVTTVGDPTHLLSF